jgi:hypothetical protein
MVYRGLVAGGEPTPEEAEQIARRKAEIRQSKVDEILSRRVGGYKDSVDGPVAEREVQSSPSRPVSGGTCPDCGTPFGAHRRCYKCKPTHPVGRPESAGDCPDCGRPFGVRRRCYKCVPINPPKDATSELAVPAVRSLPEAETPSVPSPAPVLPVPNGTSVAKGVQGVRAIVDVLAGLDDESARWLVEAAYTLSRRAGR